MIKKLWMSLAVCCAALFLCAGENTPAESADETAVKEVVLQIHRCLREFDIAGAMAFIQIPDYEYTDADGSKTGAEELQEDMAQLADMGRVLSITARSEATLLELVAAVFAMNSDELDSETRALISEVADTDGGRKLADESRRTLSDMLTEYQNQMDEKIRSYRVVSVAVDGNKAQLVYTIRQSDETVERITAELVKGSDGRWKIVKQRAAGVDAE